MSEMREGTPEWALAYMEDAARHTLLDEGSGTKELRKAVKVIATALAEAKAEGRRQGLEEAAKIISKDLSGWPPSWTAVKALEGVASTIRKALATAPAETQKPETGESDLEHVRHLKRGTEYEVLGEAEAQVAKGSYSVWPKGVDVMSEAAAVPARLLSDGHMLTVYRDPKTGKLWCRFTDEMRDGRFETLAAGRSALAALEGGEQP